MADYKIDIVLLTFLSEDELAVLATKPVLVKKCKVV